MCVPTLIYLPLQVFVFLFISTIIWQYSFRLSWYCLAVCGSMCNEMYFNNHVLSNNIAEAYCMVACCTLWNRFYISFISNSINARNASLTWSFYYNSQQLTLLLKYPATEYGMMEFLVFLFFCFPSCYLLLTLSILHFVIPFFPELIILLWHCRKV